MPRRSRAFLILGGAALSLFFPIGIRAQAIAVDALAPVAVYLDCQSAGCDSNYFRTEIPFVSWVLDREASDVHLLVTSLTSGGGGRQYTLAFIGRRRFAGDSVQLAYASRGDATNDDLRSALADRFKAGLMRYAARTSAIDRLKVTYTVPAATQPGPTVRPVSDPWNAWVISLGLNGNGSGEASTSFLYMSGNLTAARVTDTWKIGVGGLYNRSRSRYELSDRNVVAVRTNWGANGVIVKTVANHWSTGMRFTSSSNSAQNQDIALSIGPGIEYNFFPYTQSTRRSLTLQYLVTTNHMNWTEQTIFGSLEETHPAQSAIGTVTMNQPWGSVRLNLSLNQYLHDLGKYNLQLGGNYSWRVFRGFSLSGGGNYMRIRDQLFLPRGELTDDEILTQQIQLATGYRYFTYFGLTYRFGSVLNNVVNPRFGPDIQQGTFFF